MLYGTPQAGNNSDATKNVTSLEPGARLTLLDGTETIVSGSKSVAFSLGFHEAGGFPLTFNVSGCANGTTVHVECAADDAEGEYYDYATIAIDATGNGAYTDSGASPYRRILIPSFANGDKPIVKVSR